MRLGNVRGRLALLMDAGAVDVEKASGGRFAADPQAVFARWAEFRAWADSAPETGAESYAESDLQCPAPRPAQVFGIGLNYRAHAEEAGLPIPSGPPTFTKFPSCLTGPFAAVTLPSEFVDWEVELVAVIGERAFRVGEGDGWKHVAALTVGQDISERVVQWGNGGQFSLGKSFPGFGPLGPVLVTPDEFENPDELELGCRVSGELMQSSRTSDMIFSVPRLIAELSAILPLLPGDILFTGTPQGVGAVRKPPRFLKPGDTVESWIEGIGAIRNKMIAATA